MDQDRKQSIALMRYSAIAPLISGTQADYESLSAFFREASEKGVKSPDGELRHYSPCTIEKWYITYKKEGFDALIPSTRSDRGTSRKIDDALAEEIRYLKHTYPRLPASAIYRQLQDKGIINGRKISEATICRFINQMMLQERTRLALDKRKTPVIIIDEANYINNAVLNDLKILFNFEMDSKDRAVILLVGLPQINHTLQLAVHEPLRQRLLINYNIDGYTKAEGREYIENKLKGAGCSQEVFDDAAIEAILNASDGTARMISKLCNSCLVIGNSKGKNIISADTVMEAVNENTLE